MTNITPEQIAEWRELVRKAMLAPERGLVGYVYPLRIATSALLDALEEAQAEIARMRGLLEQDAKEIENLRWYKGALKKHRRGEK